MQRAPYKWFIWSRSSPYLPCSLLTDAFTFPSLRGACLLPLREAYKHWLRIAAWKQCDHLFHCNWLHSAHYRGRPSFFIPTLRCYPRSLHPPVCRPIPLLSLACNTQIFLRWLVIALLPPAHSFPCRAEQFGWSTDTPTCFFFFVEPHLGMVLSHARVVMRIIVSTDAICVFCSSCSSFHVKTRYLKAVAVWLPGHASYFQLLWSRDLDFPMEIEGDSSFSTTQSIVRLAKRSGAEITTGKDQNLGWNRVGVVPTLQSTLVRHSYGGLPGHFACTISRF